MCIRDRANTPELMLPLFDRLEAYMEDFKVNARELFNCQGIHAVSYTHLDVYKRQIFLSSGSVPQHGNHVYSVVLDAYNNEWILTDKGCFVYGKRELSDKRDFKLSRIHI